MPHLFIGLLKLILGARQPTKTKDGEISTLSQNPFAYGTQEALNATLWCQMAHIVRDSQRLRVPDKAQRIT